MAVGVPSWYGHLIIPTPSLTTGNVGNVFDVVGNNAVPPVPPGAIWFTKDPGGNTVEYQYVKLNSSSAGNWAPGTPLFYRDGTRTLVSDYQNDAATYVATTATHYGSFAGVLLNQNAVSGNNTSDAYIVIQKQGVIPIQWGGNGVAGNANSVGNNFAIGTWGVLAANNANNGTQGQWLTTTSNNGIPSSVPDNFYLTGLSATQAFLVGPVI